MSRRRSCIHGLLFAAVLGQLGCSDGNSVRVRGVVTLEGEPIADANVTLVSVKENRRPAYGKTDAAGRFRTDEGVPPGEYKVVVTVPTKLGPQSGPLAAKGGVEPSPYILHVNYANARTTPFVRVVPPAEGQIKLDLKQDGS